MRRRKSQQPVDPTEPLASGTWIANVPLAQHLYETWSENLMEAKRTGRVGGLRGKGSPKHPWTAVLRRLCDWMHNKGSQVTVETLCALVNHKDELWKEAAYHMGSSPMVDLIDLRADEAGNMTFEFTRGEETMSRRAIAAFVTRYKPR